MVSKGDTLSNGDTMALAQAGRGVVLRRMIVFAGGNSADVLEEWVDGTGTRVRADAGNGNITTSGAISAAGALTATGGLAVTGNLTRAAASYDVQGVSPSSGVAPTIVTGNTITPAAGVMRTTNGGAVTGIIIAVGTVDGQTVTVTNEGSGSITFAAVATSHVADGVTTVIPVLTARTFIWMANAATPAWYRVSG